MIGTSRNYRWAKALREVLTLGLAVLIALMFAAAKPAQAAHPGTNGKVIFSSTRDGDADIYTMNTDGTGVTQVVNSPGIDNEPSIGPGGKSFVFVSNRDGDKEIYVMDLDGTNLKQLTTNTTVDNFPKWANDEQNAGEEIAYSGADPSFAGAGTDTELFLVGTEMWPDDSGDLTVTPDSMQLTDNAMNDSRPTYNATTGALFWNQNESPTITRDVIVKMQRDAGTGDFGAQSTLTPTGAPEEAQADVSPDGSKLLYVEGSGTSAEIYRIDTDGTNRTAVISRTDAQNHPTYFPDGLKLTYTDSAPGNEEVLKANASDGSVRVNITNNAAADDHAEVAPVTGTSTAIGGVMIDEANSTAATHSVQVSFTRAGSFVAGDTFECKLDSGSWAACSSPYTFTGVSNGSHTIYARAVTSGTPEPTPASTTYTYDGPYDDPDPELGLIGLQALKILGVLEPVANLAGIDAHRFGHIGSPAYSKIYPASGYYVVSKLRVNDHVGIVCDYAKDGKKGAGYFGKPGPNDLLIDRGYGGQCAELDNFAVNMSGHKSGWSYASGLGSWSYH